MECDDVRPRLDAYFDGELPESERTPLREHLQGCHDCRPEAAALDRLRRPKVGRIDLDSVFGWP